MPTVKRPFLFLLALILVFTWGETFADIEQNPSSIGLVASDIASDESESDAQDESVPVGEGLAGGSGQSKADQAPPLHFPQTLHARFENAEWVSLVRIRAVSALVNPNLSKAHRFSAVQGYSYLAEVIKDWKGSQPASLKFRVDLTDCLQMLERNVEYIVFGVKNIEGSYQTMSCQDILAYDREGGVPANLDNFSFSQVNPRQ